MKYITHTNCLYSTLKLALICKDKVLIIIGINQYIVNQTKHHKKSSRKDNFSD